MNQPIQNVAPQDEENKPGARPANNGNNDNNSEPAQNTGGGAGNGEEDVRDKLRELQEEIDRLKERVPCPDELDLNDVREDGETKQGANDNEEEESEDEREGVDFGGTVVNGLPKTYHSQVRDTACVWELVRRRSAGQVIMNLSGLTTSTRSEEFSSQTTQKVELSKIIKASVSEEIKAELGFATGTASLSAEQINQQVETYLSTHQFILMHYIVTISGAVRVRKDWTVTETWNYTGENCNRDEPRNFNEVITGPTASFNVSTTHHIWEMRAPSIPPRGTKWAEDEAKKKNNELAARGAWLPELPLPANLPANVG